MKVAIVIVTYNIDARVFLLQIEAIGKLCNDDFDINVIDNSTNEEFSESIRYHCSINGIDYKKIRAGSENGSDSHCFALKFAYESIVDTYEWYLFLDHDCIPVKPFSVIDILGEKIMAGVGQGKSKKYLWVGCLLINATEIDKDSIDLNYSHEHGLDSGGNLYKLIEEHGEENFIFFDEVYCQLNGFKGKHGYYALINKGMFCHWANGSNWEGAERHEERVNALLNVTQELIDEAE